MSAEIFFYPMVIIKRKKETVWVKKVTQNLILFGDKDYIC